MIKPFKLISETEVYSNRYFTILDRFFEMPNGKQQHFFVQKEVDTCCVLAMTKEKTFITVKEYRVGPMKIMHELPAGRLESEKDDPDERIRKELLEETGYTGDFTRVGVLPTSPYSTRMIYCYSALNCKKISDQKLDENEFIEVELLSAQKLSSLLAAGRSSSCGPGLLAWEWIRQNEIL